MCLDQFTRRFCETTHVPVISSPLWQVHCRSEERDWTPCSLQCSSVSVLRHNFVCGFVCSVSYSVSKYVLPRSSVFLSSLVTVLSAPNSDQVLRPALSPTFATSFREENGSNPFFFVNILPKTFSFMSVSFWWIILPPHCVADTTNCDVSQVEY